MAALGLVHVMTGDEHGEALGGEAVNLFPELAACFWVHPGGGFVEQQKFGCMNEASRAWDCANRPEAWSMLAFSAFFFDRKKQLPHLDLLATRDAKLFQGSR